MLNGFGSRLWSFRIGGTMGCSAPKPDGNVGSLESSSRVTLSGSGDVTEKTVGISVVWIPDSSVKFRKLAELFRYGLHSLDSCSTKSTSESIELIDMLEAILKFLWI